METDDEQDKIKINLNATLLGKARKKFCCLEILI